MTVNFEVKGMLARLLATEDIVVEHRHVETACFDVQNRVLTLPIWEKASNEIYDLLLSHEAAHALYTPTDDWTKTHDIPMQYVNIVEDARIEKLVKRRYAGLSKTFYLGYKELVEKDFFELKDDDVSTYGFADRVNIYFKIGTHLQLTFTPEEQAIVDLISECETFNDALDASKVLYDHCNKNHDELQLANIPIPMNVDVIAGQVQGGDPIDSNGNTAIASISNLSDSSESQEKNGSDNSQNGNGNTEDNSVDKIDNKSGNQNNSDSQGGSDVPNNSSENEENTGGQINESVNKPSTVEEGAGSKAGSSSSDIKTVDRLNKAIQELIDKEKTNNYIYIETPKLNLKEVVIPVKDIERVFRDFWKHTEADLFKGADEGFNNFKKSAQREVNFLVKEFESKKAADMYSRSLTSRTGVLDCTKLHTYKFNDDLFKKITTLPDGKNHGLIFILDWSGSMNDIIFDTIKQLYNLVWFCKKVSIPFEVYAFTTDYPYIKYDKKGKSHSRGVSYDPKHGLVAVGHYFSLMNFLSSQLNSCSLNIQMRNIFRIAYALENRRQAYYKIPSGLRLSGTPLNESLIALQEIIPDFKARCKVQKVQCIVLTDGDACPSAYHVMGIKSPYGRIIDSGINAISTTSFLRNRKTGNIYSFNGDYWDQPRVFLKNLRDMFPDTSFIGFRILSSGSGNLFIRRYYEGDEHKKLMDSWREHKSCSIKDVSGYHKYFALSSSTLAQDAEFNVSDTASKLQIKNAFMKSVKTKKTNKKILTEFIDLIV